MRLVPRQLRRTDFPSSVPYYGGRLTPGVIAGLEHPAAPAAPRAAAPPPPPPGAAAGQVEPPAETEQSRLLGALDDLRARGVVTESEYEAILGRLQGRE